VTQPEPLRGIAIAAFFVLTIWLGRRTSAPLKGGPLIICLELAFTTTAANKFLESWKRLGDWQNRLLLSLQRDTWFILAYAPFSALVCWWASDHFSAAAQPLLRWLASAQLLAGALDFIENFGMKKTIVSGEARQPWPLVAAVPSAIKWLLLLFGWILLLVDAIDWLIRMVKGA
jgi:hypothetical protein